MLMRICIAFSILCASLAFVLNSVAQQSTSFDQIEQRWRDYRQSACAAAFNRFDRGPGGPPFEQECEIRLTRNRLRELNMIYGNLLHL